MAIVTVSQQLGSGGTEVGMAVADRLGYCFVDHKRGGQWLLRDVPYVVRGRVVAPAGVRATELLTVLSEQGGERIGAHVGARMDDDAQKAKRMRYLFDVELNDPTLYHLVINTGQLDRGAAVELIAALVERQPQFARGESGKQMVVDGRSWRGSRWCWRGTRPRGLEHAETVIGDLPGVREIRLRAVEIPPMPPFVG